MLPDVIDEFVLKYGTRKESIFYSFYVFFSKLSIGVGLGISQAVLAQVYFDIKNNAAN
jgi:Na+/melibiose symporter-like transporter